MEWQTRLPASGRKRPNDAARHEFRVRQSQSPAQLSVSRAEASGSARMLTGTVSGDNVHGNVTHVFNYYNSDRMRGDRDPNDPATYHNFSSVLSDSEKGELFIKLHFPQLDARLTNLRKAGRRTCEWLLKRKDYRAWTDVDSKHLQTQDGLFWIRGNPGTGKSIAMKFLFQKMHSKLKRDRDVLVLSFFFNARGSDLEKSTLGLYRSLLFGILSSDQSLLEVLGQCTRSQCLSILSGEWERKHEPLLQELCEKATDLLAQRKKRLYFYVDALDECPENEVRDMVTYLEDLMADGKSCTIRVCFSRRHYPRISIKTKLTITLEHEASHNDDIKTYIESELRFDEHTDQVEVDRLREAIFQKSAGIFLWVSLAVRQLNDVFDNDGRMDAIWERLEEIPRAAKEIPVSHGDLALYGLFQDVIMKDTRNIPDLVRLTQLIFCAKRLLSPQEAFVALRRSYHEPFDADKVNPDVLSKQILAISKGLAEVTGAKEPTVQFIHETVREFLRDGGLEVISKLSMRGDGNEVLKSSCLEQIRALDSVTNHSELLADYRTWTRYRTGEDENMSHMKRDGFRKQMRQIFPFLQYATQYVLCHANAAAAQGVPQGPFLASFPRHLWVSLHNLFEKAKSKRFSRPDIPISYILAGHGLNDLVRISSDQQNYATLYEDEHCPTALHHAIYSGHLDTERALVGLGPKEQPPRLDEPRLKLSDCRKTFLKAILDADDVDILRKVIQDRLAYLQPQGPGKGRLILKDCRSVAMIDCLAEHSMLPGISPADENDQNCTDGDESTHPTSEVFFIRKAIEKHPNILTDTVWCNSRMLDYAIEKRFLPLLTLYLDLTNSRDLAKLNNCLERAAIRGYLAAVKEAHSRGAELDYEDESGWTVLHKMFTGRLFELCGSVKQRDMCSVMQYLLFRSPKLATSMDKDGSTAFDLIRNDLRDSSYWFKVEETKHKRALEILVKAGAARETGFVSFTCKDHQYPWVAIPEISIGLSMQLMGKREVSYLNAPDSLGRTALSWCFWSPHDAMTCVKFWFYDVAEGKGMELLKYPEVDVNSRDILGCTILEHVLRHPALHYHIAKLTVAFFKSTALDVNLVTSDRRSPLDLLMSLYGTWPADLGDIETIWMVDSYRDIKGVEKQVWFSEGLFKTARLLLATRKVDLSEQKRCLAKAPDGLRALILESIKKVEPGYHLQTVSDQGQ